MKKYNNSSKFILLLSNINEIHGLNLSDIDKVILVHNLEEQEKSSLFGLVNRIGRTKSLEVIKLLYPNQ